MTDLKLIIKNKLITSDDVLKLNKEIKIINWQIDRLNVFKNYYENKIKVIMKKLPLPKQKAIKKHLDREKSKKDARLQFYLNKDKYFKSKGGADGQAGKDSPANQ